MSLQLDGNPIRSIRRDIIQGGTTRILKMLRDRSTDDDSTIDVKHVATIGQDENVFPDRFQMSRTRTLSIPMKNLTDIPDSVFMTAQVESVNVIDLSKNKLSTIPEGLVFLNF